MPDNKALFSAITKGYTKYSQKSTIKTQPDAATQAFISILNTNGVHLDDDVGTGNQFENMLPLESYSYELTAAQEKNIAIALSEYCFAGGGPLYDAIKSELSIEHNIDLLDAPIVIENLDKPKAIQFLTDSLAQKANSDHSAIWLFLILNKILEPHAVINHLNFMCYWHEQHRTKSHVQYQSSLQDFADLFDSVFKQPYTELHGQILSQPFTRTQAQTRLQETATVCPEPGYSQATQEKVKNLLIKMLKIPGINIKNEVGCSWIETLSGNFSTEYFTEILDVIPTSMLQEFYDTDLYLKIANDLGDIWTLSPVQQTQYRQRCSLLLKILNTAQISLQAQTLKAKLEKLKELADMLEFVTPTEPQEQPQISLFFSRIKNFVRHDEPTNSPRYHYFSQLKNIDRISAEKVNLKLAYFINNTVLHLVQIIMTDAREDMYCRGISGFVKNINVFQISKNSIGLAETTASYIYQSIEQSLALLNKKNTINQITPKMITDFIALIEALEFFLNKFATLIATDESIKFLNIEDMLKNDGIKKTLSNAFIKMLIVSTPEQIHRLKATQFYKKLTAIHQFQDPSIELQKELRNVGNAIYVMHKDNTYQDYTAPKNIYFNERSTYKELFVNEITVNLKKLDPLLNLHDISKIMSLTQWLEIIFTKYHLTINDFEESIQIIYARLQLEVTRIDNNAQNITLTEQLNTFMELIKKFSSGYTSGFGNWIKLMANSGESMRCAEFIAALPYNGENDEIKKSSLFKAILRLISYRLISYQSESHRKSFYHENLKPAFEALLPIELSDIHKKIILYEITRALNVPDLVLRQNDDRLQLLAVDLGVFTRILNLDITKVKEILHQSKFYTLSGTSATSSMDTTPSYGSLMQTAASGGNIEITRSNDSTTEFMKNNF